MSDFLFEDLIPFEWEKFDDQSLYLVVWYAQKIPPHIGCVFQQAYYSKKVKGVDFAIPFKKTIQLIESKKIPTLLIQINHTITQAELESHFLDYKTNPQPLVSCLAPLKSIFHQAENTEIQQLAHLLEFLKKNNQLSQIFSLNLIHKSFALPTYGAEEIQKRLAQLAYVERKKHTS